MLKVAVLVSGGGTNLQAIIDGIENGSITNAKIDVVISNNKNAYALERAKKHDIEAVALSPKDFETRDLFNEALYNELVDRKIDLIVLAGCLVVIPEKIIHEFENRIINIHPSLIPSFCGTGYYGLKVHEKALARGVKVSGATVHFVDEGTDTGPIIAQKAVEIKQEILQKFFSEELWSRQNGLLCRKPLMTLLMEGSKSKKEKSFIYKSFRSRKKGNER